MTPAYPAGEMPQYLGGLRMPPRRRAFAPGMAAGGREENYFSAPQGQNPPQNRQNPQKIPRRQCRFAASRIAGSSNRSRQRTGDSRPPAAAGLSPAMPPRGEPDRWRFQQKQAADRGLPSSVPRGKVQEGVSPSWFPAQAGKNPNHFSRRHARREKFLSRSEVWPQGRLWAVLRPRPSGVTGHRLSALGALRRGLLAGENRLGDFSQRRACRRRAARPSGA